MSSYRYTSKASAAHSSPSSANLQSNTNMNYSLNMLNEIKKFNQNAQQLNILLDETNNACKELKVLQQTSLSDNIENFQLHPEDEQFVKSLQTKKLCFVIFGQNVLAKSILVNEILSRYLLPFQLNDRVNDESWRMIRIKHGKMPGYTFQLVDTEFELMSSEYLNKKFIFTGTTPPVPHFTSDGSSPPESYMNNAAAQSTASSSANVPTTPKKSTSTAVKNGPINIKPNSPGRSAALASPSSNHKSFSMPQIGAINPFLSSSSTFTVPIDDLRLDKELVEARAKFENLISKSSMSDEVNFGDQEELSELDDAKFNLEKAEAIAENQAVLEINLDNRLLEQNVEILVHSKSMPKYIYEKLSQDIIPIYLYGIIENKLSEQDIKDLKEIQDLVDSNPILFVKIPEIDSFLEQYSSPTPTSADSSPSQSSPHLTSEWTKQQLEQHQSLKKANHFLKYLINSSQMLAATTSSSSPPSGPSSLAAFSSGANSNRHALTIFSQLCDLNFLNILPTANYGSLDDMASTIATLPHDYSYYSGGSSSAATSPLLPVHAYKSSLAEQSHLISSLALVESELCEKWHSFMHFLFNYVNRNVKSFLIKGAAILSKFHEYCLSKFINFAYEMARDMLVTPRKIEYAREKEQILFESLNSLASMKQEELKNLINSTIELHRQQILDMARTYEFVNVELIRSPILSHASSGIGSSSSNSASSPSLSADALSTDTNPPGIHESVSSNSSATSSTSHGIYEEYVTVKYAKDYKKCTNQIQELVINRLNNAIGQKLTESVEILKENYIGTLKRCLQTLEELNSSSASSSPSLAAPNGNLSFSGGQYPASTLISPTHPFDGASFSSSSSSSVSEALQQILNAAYQVEVNFSGSSSFLKLFIQRMKELIKNMPWTTSPNLNEEWKVTIASNMLDSLSESKLAKILCNQMRERLTSSHYLFTQSLKMLEAKHNGRLEKTEESQNVIRKVLAPKFAKLNLETTSLKDFVLHGMPILSKEIGRGQYGVVYNCLRWAKYENLAVKSVVPPDEKHWNDLALEYHYTKQIIDHDRIVKLIGSVIDYSYGNGHSPAVLLIMELMKRDLYSALKVGLDWRTRMQLSIDVVEGIRYLHGRGLVHRDIKLKNVLLDSHNRAKITDLGFCKPEAMMSGSIVGTPIHMPPEVFNSKYDSSVDIYAFGILFWYICSGSVRLPHNFELCSTKDDLWSAVKRGVRPERLSLFDDDCWVLMESCWKHDPKQRPHIGVVASSLEKILAKCPPSASGTPRSSSSTRIRKP